MRKLLPQVTERGGGLPPKQAKALPVIFCLPVGNTVFGNCCKEDLYSNKIVRRVHLYNGV